MPRKYKFAQRYEVIFWDHATGDKPIKFKACGYFIGESEIHIHLTSWFALCDDIEMRDNNYESYSIVKSCIERVTKCSKI